MEELKSLSDIASSICTKLIEKDGLFSADIFLYWDEIVGGYAKLCAPFKLTTVNGANHLFISPKNNCPILDLQYSTEIIKQKVNTFFGNQVVNSVKIYKEM